MKQLSERAFDRARAEIALRWSAMVVVILLFLLASQSGADTRVSLRSVVRAPADAPVTLGQIAILDGDDAASLSKLVVIERLDETTATDAGWVEIDIERIKELLEEQNVRLSTLELRGGSCAIMPTLGHAERQVPAAIDIIEEPRQARSAPTGLLRDLAASAIARTLAVGANDLRLTFDKRDEQFLNGATSGRVFDVKPTGVSDRMPLSITVYQGDRIVHSRTIKVEVLVRRTVLVTTRDIRRGDVVAKSDTTPQEQWLTPTAAPALASEALGRVATRSIPIGRVVEAHMVEPPIVVRRGELVNIHCISGSILIELQRMRARRDGREGETIEFESADGSKRRLQARVSGPGQAVIVATSLGGGL